MTFGSVARALPSIPQPMWWAARALQRERPCG